MLVLPGRAERDAHMYDRPKGNYSFLIALSKQLQAAIETHRDDDVGLAVESLRVSLDMLLGGDSDSPGGYFGGPDESVDDLDAPGDDTPLGAALARIAELERDAVHVDKSGSRRSVEPGAGLAPEQPLDRKRPGPPVLRGKGKKVMRRGKK